MVPPAPNSSSSGWGVKTRTVLPVIDSSPVSCADDLAAAKRNTRANTTASCFMGHSSRGRGERRSPQGRTPFGPTVGSFVAAWMLPGTGDRVVLFRVLRSVSQQTQHLVDPDHRVIYHAFPSPRLNPSTGAGCPVAALGGGANGGEIAEVAVGVPEEEAIADRAASAPVHLKVNEGFAGHSHQRDPPIDQHGGDWQLLHALRGGIVSVESSWVDFRAAQDCLAKFLHIPAEVEGEHILGKIQTRFSNRLRADLFGHACSLFTQLLSRPIASLRSILFQGNDGVVGIDVPWRAL